MKHFRIYSIVGLQLMAFKLFAQVPTYSKSEQANLDKWYDTYKTVEYTAFDYIHLFDTLQFKFVKNEKLKGVDATTIKAVFLQTSIEALRQMNRDGNYYCSLRHDEYYELWNIYYPKISKPFWDQNCKGLVILMSLDEIVTLH